MDFIERIARAIYFAGEGLGPESYEANQAHWEHWWSVDRAEHEAQARAALAAMRDPTQEMIFAGGRSIEMTVCGDVEGLATACGNDAALAWSKMLDAALLPGVATTEFILTKRSPEASFENAIAFIEHHPDVVLLSKGSSSLLVRGDEKSLQGMVALLKDWRFEANGKATAAEITRGPSGEDVESLWRHIREHHWVGCSLGMTHKGFIIYAENERCLHSLATWRGWRIEWKVTGQAQAIKSS